MALSLTMALPMAPATAQERQAEGETGATTLYDVAQRLGVTDTKGRQVLDLTGEGVTIALIDTGVALVEGLAHSDVTLGPDFTPEDMSDDHRSLDTNGHGTHLAGIMVGTDAAWAKGDRTRTADRALGIAPDAELLSIKAGAADGGTDISQVIAAINWTVAQHESGAIDIDVLNLAFSADSAESYVTDPLTYAVERAWHAGIVVVVAAGNEGREQTELTSPARDPYVIAVGASELTKRNMRAEATDFSSVGDDRPADIHAPGNSIVSLRNPGSWSDGHNEAGRVGDDLVRASGTSQAAAVTSGAVALLLEARPGLSPDEVKAALTASADLEVEGRRHLRHLRLAHAIRNPAKKADQTWPLAEGTGSLDAVRGEMRPVIDGVALDGEVDIFGNDWSGSRWTTDAWSGSRWTGSRWTSDAWSGTTWAGSRWTAGEWSGSRWTGSRWTAGEWSGSRWTGSRWTGSRWTGSRWTGADWS